MHDMRDTPIVNIHSARGRARLRMRDLVAAAAAAAAAQPDRAHPPAPRHGRAWLNGVELGGHDRRYEHLTRAHD
jgi:hypothetical protein